MNAAKILIVEDDPSMIKILATTLTKEGYEVLQAQDGKEGLDLALSSQPDLLLLDLLLPTMSGLDILRSLRKDERGAAIPVMILTNLDENDEIYKTVANTTSAYIIKSNSSLEFITSEVKRQLSEKNSVNADS